MSGFVPEALTKAWSEFMMTQRGTHAVTLCYNPRYGGTTSTGYRIVQSKADSFSAIRSETQANDNRVAVRPSSGHVGSHRLPTVRYIAPETVQADITNLHGRIDHELYGCRYNRRPVSKRTSYVGFIEHETSNIHVHLAWRVPDNRRAEFDTTLTDEWSKLCPFGTVKIVPVKSDGWAAYMVKARYNVAFGDAALFVASAAKPT